MNRTITIVVAISLTLLFAASALGGDIGAMKKGSWFMAGGWTAGFAKQGGDLYKSGDDSPTVLQLDPCLGYFFMDGLAVGALLSFDSYTMGDYKSTGFGFGPKVYYYIGANKNDIEKGKMVPYLTGSFTLVSDKTESPSFMTDEITTSKSSGTNIHLGGGGIYMFANSFGVFGEAYYEMHKSKVKEPVEGESVSGSEFGVMIGVNAFFSLGK